MPVWTQGMGLPRGVYNNVMPAQVAQPTSLNVGGNISVGSTGPTVAVLITVLAGLCILYATTLKIQGSR